MAMPASVAYKGARCEQDGEPNFACHTPPSAPINSDVDETFAETSVSSEPPATTQQKPRSQDSAGTLRNEKSPTISTAEVGDRVKHRPVRNYEMWNPWALHRITLLGMAVVCTLLAGVVVLLYRFSESHNGIARQYASNHYAWTYGPMVVVLLVAAVWHQIDYQCRSLTPWMELAQGPKPADRTVLLDYISPMSIIVWFRATRKGHWAVAASSAAVILLDLAAIFSTSLFMLLPVTETPMDQHVTIRSRFSAQKYDPSSSSAAAMVRWGVLQQGLEPPLGTTESFAFNYPATDLAASESEIVQFNVPAFVSGLDCTVADVSTQLSESQSLGLLVANISTRNCALASQDLYVYGGVFTPDNPKPRILSASLTTDRVECMNQPDNSETPWLFLVTDMRYWQSSKKHVSRNTTVLTINSWTMDLAQVSALLCFPNYAIRPASITMSAARGNVMAAYLLDAHEDGTSNQIEGFNNSVLASGMSSSFALLSNSVPAPWSDDPNESQQAPNSFFTMMGLESGISSLNSFLDPAVTMRAANKTFSGVAAQVAHHDLSIPSTSEVPSTLRFTELRIVTKTFAVIVLIAVFSVSAISALLVLALRPSCVVPLVAHSVISHAAILSASASLRAQLGLLGCSSDEELRTLLRSRRFSLINKEESLGYSDCILEVDADSHRTPLASDRVTSWWRPIPSRSFAMIGLGGLCLGAIVGLEVIRSYSHTDTGFVELHVSRTAATAWSTLTPTAIMVGLKLLFRSQGFYIQVFSPFAAMSKGRRWTQRTMLYDAVGQLPVVNLWRALRSKNPAVFLTSISLVLSSFLTVIVSGLFSLETFTTHLPGSVQTIDRFNFNWSPLNNTATSFSGNAEASVLYSLTDTYNLSYPALTYAGLVFPKFAIPESSGMLGAHPSSSPKKLEVAIPAVRSALNCSLAVPGSTSVSWIRDPDAVSQTMEVYSQFLVPEMCSQKPKTQVVNMTTNDITVFDSSGQYFSQTATFPWGTSLPEYPDSTPAQYPGSCYTIGYTFGFTGPESLSPENITSFACYQMIEEVNTVTTFNWPELTIDASSPPRIDEASARVLLPHVNFFLDDMFVDDDCTIYPIDSADTSISPDMLTPIFQHVVHGANGVPAHELLGPHNRHRLLEAFQNTYQRFMAQAINVIMRKPLEEAQSSTSRRLVHRGDRQLSASSKKYSATLVSADGLCVVQNNGPRVALEVLLALTLACAIAAYLLTPMKRVLPHNPTTIAGMMTLLASGGTCRSNGLHDPLIRNNHAANICSVFSDGSAIRSMSDVERVVDWRKWKVSIGYWGNNGFWNDDSDDIRGKDGQLRYGIGLVRRAIDPSRST